MVIDIISELTNDYIKGIKDGTYLDSDKLLDDIVIDTYVIYKEKTGKEPKEEISEQLYDGVVGKLCEHFKLPNDPSWLYQAFENKQ